MSVRTPSTPATSIRPEPLIPIRITGPPVVCRDRSVHHGLRDQCWSRPRQRKRRMPRLTKFDEYRDRYSDSYVLEMTDDGILLMRMHTDGGPVNWNKAVLDTPNLFADVAGDRDVR